MARGWPDNVILVVGLHLSSVLVDKRLEAVPFALDDEFACPAERGRGKQDELCEGKQTVAFRNLGGGLGLLDLLGDDLGGVEKIDLAVWGGVSLVFGLDQGGSHTRITGGHLGSLQARNHGVHEMCALGCVSLADRALERGLNYLLVSQPGQPVLCSSKQLPLVHTTELSIDLEVFLVEDLEDGVQKTGQRRIVRLLDNLGTGLLCVMFGHDRAELVNIHDAEYPVSVCRPDTPLGDLLFGALLVGAAQDKLQLVGWHANSLEDLGHAELVVGGAVVDQLNRSLEVVKKAMAVTVVSNESVGKWEISYMSARRIVTWHPAASS